MNKLLKYMFTALVGAGLGASGAFFYLKDKYEKELEKEIAEVKEVYEKHRTELIKKLEEDLEKRVAETKMIDEVSKRDIHYSTEKEVNVMDYVKEKYGKAVDSEEIEVGNKRKDEPDMTYVGDAHEYISETEFDELSDIYEKEYFSLYYDGMLLRNNEFGEDDQVEDLDGTVGRDYEEHFVSDKCFVINHETNIAYKIDYYHVNFNE